MAVAFVKTVDLSLSGPAVGPWPCAALHGGRAGGIHVGSLCVVGLLAVWTTSRVELRPVRTVAPPKMLDEIPHVSWGW